MHRLTKPASMLAIVAALTAIIACSDRTATSPDATKSKLGTQGGANGGDTSATHHDTATVDPDTTTKPDTGVTHPDTGSTHPDTGHTNPDTGGTKPDTGRGTNPDTSGTVGPDTTQADAYVHGSVVGIDSSAGRSATITPLAGVAVTLFKRPPMGFAATRDGGVVHGDSVATVSSRSDGSFAFEKLRGGYYILRAVPSTASGYPTVDGYPVTAWSIRDLVTTAPVTIYLHKR